MLTIVGTLEGKRWLSSAATAAGHRLLPMDDQLSGQHLRLQDARRRADHLGQFRAGRSRKRSGRAISSSPTNSLTGRGAATRFSADGIAAHISFAQPVCPELSKFLYETGRRAGHPGPSRRDVYLHRRAGVFEPRPNRKIYRSWGCDVIGMTSATEAKLCREAEICYATMNLATDYDVWHAEEEASRSSSSSRTCGSISTTPKPSSRKRWRRCRPTTRARAAAATALKNAIVTNPKLIPAAKKKSCV